ncbi:hypothetical protein [Rhodovulum sp. MB263]|uniref:hypothetical protein n=1 Tax=Rhodovulum sp. (strain MB263) TaxID=308754 RepID=UPI0012DAFF40|nr:hypothetical protein [Rhodovulum sp. MB263]
MTKKDDAPTQRETLSSDDIVSRILGFTLFCMGFSRAPADQVAAGLTTKGNPLPTARP